MARAAPAMQIFNVGFALLLLVGCVVIYLALPDIGRELLDLMSGAGTRIEEVLLLMSGR
ncbi:flagellar biosynthesis protein FliR [compost metagenome]